MSAYALIVELNQRLKFASSKTLSAQEWNSKESVLAGIASHCCLEWRVS